MYYGNINNLCNLPTYLKQAIENSLDIALDTNRSGRTDINESTFVLSLYVPTVPVEEAKHEIHNKYIDIQLVVEGTEMFGVSNDKLTVLEDYLEEKDLAFGTVNHEHYITLRAGDFLIFNAGESHKPVCQPFGVTGENMVRKAVIKVLQP